MGVVALPSADRRRAGELGLLGVVRHRISKAVLVRDDDWPRAGPYPDRWLARWHARVYARELATGSIPFHGEWDRLQRWLVAGHVGPMLVVASSAAPSVPPGMSFGGRRCGGWQTSWPLTQALSAGPRGR